MSEPLIHSDIGKAHTLPSRFYTDEDTFRNLISGMQDCWYFGAHSSQFAEHNVIPLTDIETCLLYTSPSPRDLSTSRMPSSA